VTTTRSAADRLAFTLGGDVAVLTLAFGPRSRTVRTLMRHYGA
jgi:hypothetical protein